MADNETVEVVEEAIEEVDENEETSNDTGTNGKEEETTETREILEEAVDKLEETNNDAENEQKEEEKEDIKEEVEEEVAEEPKPERNRWSAWKKSAQEKLNKLDPEMQDIIQAREEQFHSGIEKYKEHANYGKSIQRVLAPHKEYLQSINVAPEVAIATLIEAERGLRTGSPEQRVQKFLKMAHDYQVDIDSLSQVQFNPQLHELEKELSATKQKVASHEYSQQEQVEEEADSLIGEFSQSHEHFEDVRETMGDLMNLAAQRNEHMTMEQAYEKAIRLDDSIFEKVNAQQQEQLRKKQLLKSTQAAKVAKGAAVQVKGSPNLGGVSHATPPKTTEEAIRRAMSDMGM